MGGYKYREMSVGKVIPLTLHEQAGTINTSAFSRHFVKSTRPAQADSPGGLFMTKIHLSISSFSTF